MTDENPSFFSLFQTQKKTAAKQSSFVVKDPSTPPFDALRLHFGRLSVPLRDLNKVGELKPVLSLVEANHAQDDTSYDTSIIENTMTNSATVSPTPSTMR